MKIIVFDVPAETGGALSILQDFYNEVNETNDENIEWIFVISKPEFEDTEKIKTMNYPWVKKSWFHRLYFDYILSPRIVKNIKPDLIFSLQNTIIPRTKIKQVLYIHQSLPFIQHRYSVKNNFKFWVYQNLIGKLISNSIYKSEKVIVQSQSFKNQILNKLNINENLVEVVSPPVNIEVTKKFSKNYYKTKIFFYPARALAYKNHHTIFQAISNLEKKGIHNYRVILTLNGDEDNDIKKMYDQSISRGYPIEFIGPINRKEVFEYYQKSILLFPSIVETFGLPLIEARMHNCIIISADEPFSREVLNGYSNAYFFDSFNSNELASFMEKGINNQLLFTEYNKSPVIIEEDSSLIKAIKNHLKSNVLDKRK